MCKRYRTPCSALVTIALAAACATSPRLATAPPTLLVRIEHRPDPTIPLTVWAAPAKGERLLLGMLTTGTSNVVRFDRVQPTRQYRLVAERSGGGEVTSPPFTPNDAGVIAWDLSANLIARVDSAR
jgi:hypothetical protein